jgi:hypothetical protein
MRLDDLIAFVTSTEPPGLEIRVNFGMFAGREATAAELDDLAHALLPEVGEVTVVAEQRHELAEDTEAAVHQVRVEVDGSFLPPSASELEALGERLRDIAADWARACIADRHAEVSEL